MPTKAIKFQSTETEVEVMKVRVENIEKDVCEIKGEVKGLHGVIDKSAETTQQLIKEMRQSSEIAHASLASKISTLERWRWMMMGAGIVIGSLGFDTIAKLLQ